MRSAACLLLVVVLFAGPGFADEATDKQVADLIESMAKSDYAGQAAVDQLVKIGKPAVEALVKALKDERKRVRYWSAAAVARIKDERAYEPLVEMAKSDKDGYCRATAIWYLQFFARPAVWDLAADALKDPDLAVRGYAIRLLKDRGRTEKIPALTEAMKHESYQTRYDAMVAVATLSDDDLTDFLRGVLKTDESKDVRIGAMKCLSVVKKRPAHILNVLIDGLEDRNAEVRDAAAGMLRRGTTQEFPFDPEGDAESRRATVHAWREWFEKHKDRLQWDDARRRFEIRERPDAKP